MQYVIRNNLLGGIALFYFLVMIPIQYLYLQGLHEKSETYRIISARTI